MSLFEILENSARKYPQKTAIVYDDRQYSYADILRRVNALAAALKGAGVKPRQRVVLLCNNHNACLEIIFACAKIGAVTECINTRWSLQAISEVLASSQLSVVFMSSDMLWCLDELRCGKFVVVDGSKEGCIDYADFLETGAQHWEASAKNDGTVDGVTDGSTVGQDALAVCADENDPTLIFYTSGTTGRPKGVQLSTRAVMTQVMVGVMEARWPHDEVFLYVLPFFHVACIATLQLFFVGGELILGTSREPDYIAELMVKHKVTRIFGVPVLIKELADYLDKSEVEYPTSLRTIHYGAAPMSPELMQRLQKCFSCNFHMGYGMTETGGSITVLLPEYHSDPKLLSTVGKPAFGAQLMVINEEGKVCSPGENGEICTKTASLTSGYLNDPKQTARVIKDGWYRTGDIGFIDEEGFLHLTDRKGDMIISGGENVYPSEVMACIKKIGKDVVDVYVIGASSERWGECVVAFIVKDPCSQLCAEHVMAFCTKHLAKFQKPKHLYFLDELPRNNMGKIDKERLLAIHAERQVQTID